jgi:periplasmic protein TonB
MKTELILKSDVLDILFDNRNKAYGAYNLRKFYDNRLMKSLGVMLGLVVVLSAFTFIPKKVTEEISVTPDVVLREIPSAKDPIKKKEIVKLQPKTNIPNQKKLLNTIIIVPNDSKTDTLLNITPTDVIGTTNVTIPTGGSGPAIISPSTGDTGGNTVTPEPAKPPVDINTPMYSPEIMPSYPGGMEALRKFLQRNLTNPKEMEEGEEVSVKVKFVVDYDGNLKSFVTVQDGGEEFNKEVIRVLNKMPNWIPGKSNGQNVSVYYTIPVKFIAEH